MRAEWQLVLLWGVLVGVGCGFIGSYLAAYITARWFKKRQGLVIGVLTAGNAAGQLAFLPSMAAIASDAGWRAMALSLAAVVLLFVPLLVLRQHPPR